MSKYLAEYSLRAEWGPKVYAAALWLTPHDCWDHKETLIVPDGLDHSVSFFAASKKREKTKERAGGRASEKKCCHHLEDADKETAH